MKGGLESQPDSASASEINATARNSADSCMAQLRQMPEAAGNWKMSPEAWACIKSISKYERSLQQALASNEPSIFARYILDAAKQFNRFYHQEQILVENALERQMKLRIVAVVARVLQEGLEKLGIQAPAHM